MVLFVETGQPPSENVQTLRTLRKRVFSVIILLWSTEAAKRQVPSADFFSYWSITESNRAKFSPQFFQKSLLAFATKALAPKSVTGTVFTLLQWFLRHLKPLVLVKFETHFFI